MDKDNTTGRNFPNSRTDEPPKQGTAAVPFKIADGESLEAAPQGRTLEERTRFDPEIFDNLPPLIKRGCDILDETEREVFLVGALGVLSGILPNVRAIYDGSEVFPNLFVFLVGGYGSGKGGLKYARQITQPIHKARRELSDQLHAEWLVQCAQAKEAKEPEPPHPGHKMLVLPLNNSKSGLIGLLAANDGAGVLFETEADTLADALKTDHGNFSDLLRKAFHHEPITMHRRTGNELIDIDTPKLSMVLSSTPDQYSRLIPNIENGLYSRILHYQIRANHGFKNVFEPKKNDYWPTFQAIGEELKNHWETLKGLENDPITFDLSQRQKNRFLEQFTAWKNEAFDLADGELDGAINRLGLIAFRLAMVLTIVRNFSIGDYSKTAICEDRDFDNALKICSILRHHSYAIYNNLPRAQSAVNASKFQAELIGKAADIARAKTLRMSGKSYSEIAGILNASKTTIYRWISEGQSETNAKK